MPSMTTAEHLVSVSVTFFDKDGKPAKIDTQDRQPGVTFNDPAIAVAANIVVAANGESMTYDVESGLVGVTQGAYDLDINTQAGVDQSLVLPITDAAGAVVDFTITPAPPGPVAKAGTTFPPATLKGP